MSANVRTRKIVIFHVPYFAYKRNPIHKLRIDNDNVCVS